MGPGVSAAVARRFGREGFTVAALARRADTLQKEVDALGAAGVTANAYAADAADPAALTAALERAATAHGGIDVLVYNAAAARYKPLDQLGAEELAADLRVSVVGALAAAQAVLPSMRTRGSGTLLVPGGGVAFEPAPALASLGAGKAALRNLAFSLNAALGEQGIHAATVTIGGIVKPGTPFDPDRIAEAYWTLHAQPRTGWEREIVFRG
jgi:NADP-dependent 3-hydroxy acid dehydrogenase YdfG